MSMRNETACGRFVGILDFRLCVFVPVRVCVLSDCLMPKEARKGAGSGTGVIDGCELSCGCWEQSLGSLREQAFLTTIVQQGAVYL